jgi:hypothetical protein
VLCGRRMEITAESIVLSAKGGELRFSLQPGCRLLETRVEGIPVQPIISGLRTWKLSSISDVLPLHLIITYDMFLPIGEGAAMHLAAPHFTAAQIGQTLFSISGAHQAVRLSGPHVSLTRDSNENGFANCEPGEADLLRLQALARAAEEIAAAQDGNTPPVAMSEIFTRFEFQFFTVYRALQQAVQSDEAAESLLEQAAASLHAVQKARVRLEHSGVSLPDIASGGDLQDRTHVSSEQAACYWTGQSIPEVSVVLRHQASVLDAWSSLAAFLLLASAFALTLTPPAWFCQHRPLRTAGGQLAACAFLWWLLAPVGSLAWLLALMAAAALTRRPMPAPLRERGSSLLRPTGS